MRYKVFIYAYMDEQSHASSLRSRPTVERKVFPYEIQAESTEDAADLVKQRFIQEHSIHGLGWLTERVEVMELED